MSYYGQAHHITRDAYVRERLNDQARDDANARRKQRRALCEAWRATRDPNLIAAAEDLEACLE